jgi:lysozyme family protein
MSRQTIVPIEYVPLMILYVDGRPHMIYKGDTNPDEIRRFIMEVANNIKKKQQFSAERKSNARRRGDNRPNSESSSQSRQIPAYALGIPVYGDLSDNRVCYLKDGDAYNDRTQHVRR